MNVLARNNVKVSGDDSGRPMVFAHGFGCDQSMWRHVAPAFEADDPGRCPSLSAPEATTAAIRSFL